MVNTAYLVTQLNRSGPINQALNLLTGLKKTDVNAIVVTLYEERPKTWIHRFKERDIEVVQLLCNRRNPIEAKRKLEKLVKARGIQLIHSSGVMADMINAMQGKQIKKITTIRSHIADLCERRGFIVRKSAQTLCQWSFKRMDLLVGCSKSMSHDIKEDTGIDCLFVQNGVDSERFVPVDKLKKNVIRERLRLPVNSKVIITVGTLENRKNFQQIIDSVRRIDDRDLLLIVLGSGPLLTTLKERSQGDNRIRFVSHVDSPIDYYQSADFFVSASRAEGLPNTVLEAMSCGLPVLLSDIPPHHELLPMNNNAGRIFRLDDVENLRNCILEFCALNLGELSTESRCVIEKNFDKYVMAKQYAMLYHQVLGF